MKTSQIFLSKNLPLALLAPIIFGLCTTAHSQVLYSTSGTPYTQDFNGLPNSPNNSTATWTNDTTLAEWYSNRGSIRISAGSSDSATLYSWGASSATDRSLGTLNAGAGTPTRFAVQLQNTTGSTLTSFSLSYVGEQWRRNTSTAKLDFDYLVTSSNANQVSSGGYTDANALDYTASVTGTAGALDGNLNQTSISSTVSFTWANNDYLWLRWNDSTGANAAGLGIDTLVFTAVPEPSTFAALCLGLSAMLFLRRRVS